MDPAAPKPPVDSPPQPAAPSTGGGANGDNSTINGDKPIENLPSNQIVAEQESLEAVNVQTTNAAAQSNHTNSIIQQTAKDSKGESYDQIRKLGDMVEKSDVPDDLRQILNDRIARLALIRSGAGYMSSTYIMEYESTQRYINWVTGFPWNAKSKDILD